MATSYDKPRLTRDGLTAVHRCFNIFPYKAKAGAVGNRVTPEHRIDQIFGLVGSYTLEAHSYIYLWHEAELWEFMYMARSNFGPLSTMPQRWADFVALHAKRSGTYQITGNFVDLSHTWQVDTRDPSLVLRFSKAFDRQPEAYHLARAKWEAELEQAFQPWRDLYAGKTFEEVYSALEPKANTRV